MLQNYLFDFDGTLADSGTTTVDAIQAVFADYKFTQPSANEIRYYMGIPIETSFPIWTDHQADDKTLAAMYVDFRQIYGELERVNIKLFAGIKDVLATLKADNKELFIVTSKASGAIKRSLKQLAIEQYFTGTIGSDQVDHYKPAPDGVLNIARQYQLNLDQCIMIGDAKYDLQMGNAAGVATCGCKWGAYDVASLEKEKPTYLIDRPQELLTLR